MVRWQNGTKAFLEKGLPELSLKNLSINMAANFISFLPLALFFFFHLASFSVCMFPSLLSLTLYSLLILFSLYVHSLDHHLSPAESCLLNCKLDKLPHPPTLLRYYRPYISLCKSLKSSDFIYVHLAKCLLHHS